MIGTRSGGVAFHFARRERVLLRDILRLGTATAHSYQLDFWTPGRKPAWACLRTFTRDRPNLPT